MKKSVVILILLAVLVIIVSPGIVGKMAEDSVGENLNWAAKQSGDLVVTSTGFDRGWFSSEGQHRVELGESGIGAVAGEFAGAGSDLPALIIDTHIDHGIIPVTSMKRDEGSLAPGLGSAVSTLSVDLGDGEIVQLPGTIYSKVGMGGNLDSRYIVEAGTRAVEDGEVTWQPTRINVASSASSGEIEFDGAVGAMTFGNAQQVVAVDGLTFEGTQSPTQYGFNIGKLVASLGAVTMTSDGETTTGMKSFNINAESKLDDGKTSANTRIEMGGQTVPGFGEVSAIVDFNLAKIDAAALGRLSVKLDGLINMQDPQQAMLLAENEFKDLFAEGFDVEVEQFDVGLPMGTVETTMKVTIPSSDRDVFEWTSLLLATEAELNVSVPEDLVQLATSMNPQAGALIGMGYLRKEGSVYIMDTDYKKGLLTVNGAPVPIPFGAFQ